MPPRLRAAAAFDIGLRPEVEDDLLFLFALYVSTRASELAATGWPLEQQRRFLDQQHRAQHAFYRSHYPGAEWLIVEQDGEPIGRLYYADRPDALHIIDISLVETARGRGIAGAILADLLDMADAAGKTVTLMVDLQNPARGLYGRLGFVTVESDGLKVEMRRPAAPIPQKNMAS